MTDYLRVVGWEQFQHYKDRDPPWIKLHRTLLDNYEFAALGDAAKAHLMSIWLLAGRHNNKIPADPAWIGQRIAATTQVDLSALVGAGFLVEWVEDEAAGKREDWPSRYISREVKAVVWARDGGKCQRCGTKEDLEFDHIIPVSLGCTGGVTGTPTPVTGMPHNGPENIQLLCRKCNRKKRSKLQAAEQVATQTSEPAQPLRSLEGEERRDRGETEERKVEAEEKPAAAATEPDWLTQLTLPAQTLYRGEVRSSDAPRAFALTCDLETLMPGNDPRKFTFAEVSEGMVLCVSLKRPLTSKTIGNLVLARRRDADRPPPAGDQDEFQAAIARLKPEERRA